LRLDLEICAGYYLCPERREITLLRCHDADVNSCGIAAAGCRKQRKQERKAAQNVHRWSIPDNFPALFIRLQGIVKEKAAKSLCFQ
jgi:hypothetical protein